MFNIVYLFPGLFIYLIGLNQSLKSMKTIPHTIHPSSQERSQKGQCKHLYFVDGRSNTDTSIGRGLLRKLKNTI